MDAMQGMAALGMQKGSMMGNISVDDVIGAILQGAGPEELLQIGVPQEVIDQAMVMISNQTQPTGQDGLAGMNLR